MHTYTPLQAPGDPLPDITDYRFHDALDVADYARRNRQIGWQTWPDIWHLDDDGLMRCASRCSSLDGIRWWAEEAYFLRRTREASLETGTCPTRWVIVESRVVFDGDVMHEGDVVAYHAVRRELAALGVTLLDAVIFDDKCHWWSMHELTTGTTRW